MRPTMAHWWKHARHRSRCWSPESLSPSPAAPSWESPGSLEFFRGHPEGGTFGVRRPLRYLAYRLQLTEPQTAELARILDELKTERAQAAVDDRRVLTALADSVSAETFDQARASAAAEDRQKSTERLQTIVVKALAQIHALLNPEQRQKLAYLIRTGALHM